MSSDEPQESTWGGEQWDLLITERGLHPQLAEARDELLNHIRTCNRCYQAVDWHRARAHGNGAPGMRSQLAGCFPLTEVACEEGRKYSDDVVNADAIARLGGDGGLRYAGAVWGGPK